MTWYEDRDQYAWSAHLPGEITKLAGPHGPALVDVYGEGKTTKGWGLVSPDGGPGFMENYGARKFMPRPRLLDFDKRGRPFAIVMRSVNLLMVDIDRHMADGGADGFKAAAKLELPLTLAETSKGGEGRHLFYVTPDTWDDDRGFARYEDALGIVPGVDIRAVGCAYRYPSQQWNHAELAPLPQDLLDLLEQRRAAKTARLNAMAAAAAAPPDDMEALIMHDAILTRLAGPIPNGQRNSSLFSIGSDMKAAGVPEWDRHLADRANEVGLDPVETQKIIDNVEKYA